MYNYGGSNDDSHYKYDKHGNPTAITSNGIEFAKLKVLNDNFQRIVDYEHLTFTYNGNPLKNVYDAGDVGTNSNAEQFQNYASSDVKSAYNANGWKAL